MVEMLNANTKREKRAELEKCIKKCTKRIAQNKEALSQYEALRLAGHNVDQHWLETLDSLMHLYMLKSTSEVSLRALDAH